MGSAVAGTCAGCKKLGIVETAPQSTTGLCQPMAWLRNADTAPAVGLAAASICRCLEVPRRQPLAPTSVHQTQYGLARTNRIPQDSIHTHRTLYIRVNICAGELLLSEGAICSAPKKEGCCRLPHVATTGYMECKQEERTHHRYARATAYLGRVS